MTALSTPWGPPQSTRDIGRGILCLSTASHGGYFVPAELRSLMQPALRNDHGFYEEDCDWAKVAIAFPDLFTDENVACAKKTLIEGDPDVANAIGLNATVENSHTLRYRAFIEAHTDDFLVSSAFGSWHADVPQGMVGVNAVRGGAAPVTPTDAKSFLVPEDEYGGGEFVIDLSRHTETARFR